MPGLPEKLEVFTLARTESSVGLLITELNLPRSSRQKDKPLIKIREDNYERKNDYLCQTL